VIALNNELLQVCWDGPTLRVALPDGSVEQVAATDIRRVLLVCDGGDTPEHLAFALLDCGDEHVLLPAHSGIARCVYFERQIWWTQRACIYWVTQPHALLPRRIDTGGGAAPMTLLRPGTPPFLRLAAAQLEATIGRWRLEGPQTWEQRRWAERGKVQRTKPANHRRPRA
jgi:hypothetical protein